MAMTMWLFRYERWRNRGIGSDPHRLGLGSWVNGLPLPKGACHHPEVCGEDEIYQQLSSRCMCWYSGHTAAWWCFLLWNCHIHFWVSKCFLQKDIFLKKTSRIGKWIPPAGDSTQQFYYCFLKQTGSLTPCFSMCKTILFTKIVKPKMGVILYTGVTCWEGFLTLG